MGKHWLHMTALYQTPAPLLIQFTLNYASLRLKIRLMAGFVIFPYDIDVVVFPISSFSKPKLPPKAMSSCCQKYTLKPDDLSCFPKVGTTQAALLLVFSALGSNVLLSGEPIQLHCFLLLGRQR